MTIDIVSFAQHIIIMGMDTGLARRRGDWL
jgi:hypothetical protein